MQTAAKLKDHDIETGLIMSGEFASPLDPVQVAAVQTLHARAIRRNKISLPPADLLIADECHHAPAETWKKIVEAYPDAILLGLTATPCRGDGRGLGGIFDKILECPQVPELIKEGFLVGTRTYAPTLPDLKWHQGSGRRLRRETTRRQNGSAKAGRRYHQSLASLCRRSSERGVRHRRAAFGPIRDEFVKSGVTCEHLDGSTAKDERDASLARLKSGETRS